MRSVFTIHNDFGHAQYRYQRRIREFSLQTRFDSHNAAVDEEGFPGHYAKVRLFGIIELEILG